MWVKILLLFFVFSFLFRTDHSFDQDLGRHIKLGEIIVQSGQVPKTNLFSYTNPDFPFINTHWLFGVFVYLANQTVGLQALLVLKIFIFLFSVWLVIKNNKSILLLPVGFIFLHVLRERLELRPEIFSFLFTTLTLYILEKRTNLIYFLPLIQLIWINTHIYFFVGLVLQAIFILTHRKIKLLWLIFGLSLLVSLINPNGVAGLLYPLNVTTNYGYTIVENQTMFLLESIKFRDPNFLFVKLSIALVALSLVVAAIKRQMDIKNILIALFGVGLALLNVRSFPYLIFLSLPATLANFGTIKLKFLIPFFAVLLILESYFYLSENYYKNRDDSNEVNLKFVESGKEAMDFVLTKDLPNPIFNNFDIGSYIIYRGYPKYQVFVDGRPEAYPAQFFQEIYIPAQYDYNKFKELEKQIGFKTIIFSHTDQTPWGINFLQNVVKDPEWKLVYIDNFMVVFTKEGDLAKIDLNKLDPQDYKFNNHVSYVRMGLFLLSTGYPDSGRQFMSKALQLFPNSPILTGQTTKFFW